MKSVIASFIVLLLCVSAGARELQQAEAPASAAMPVADLLFILSADKATFTDATHLMMQNATSTAQMYSAGARAGVIPTSKFLNSSAGAPYVAADGQWLGTPTATLFGFGANYTEHSINLSLASPVTDYAAKTVTFTLAAVGEAAIKTSRGVANEAAQGSNGLLTAVQPGTALYDVALFVDDNKASMTPAAKTELGGGGAGGGFGGAGGGFGGGGGHSSGVNGAAYVHSSSSNGNSGSNDWWNRGWGK